MNINMRWKVMAQFLGAFFIIAIVGNIISSLVSDYYTITNSQDMAVGKTMVSFDPKELNIKKISMALQESGVNALKDPNLEEIIKLSNSWIQVLDRYGNEVTQLNKPNDIQDSYTIDEITQLYNVTTIKDNYNTYVFSDSILENKSEAVNKIMKQQASADVKEIKEKLDKERLDKEKLDKNKDDITNIWMNDAKFIYVIGAPKPKIRIYNILYGIYDYFTQWTNSESMPKTISTVFTFLLVLLLGYIFTRGITKPVVKITDGISSIAEGNYSVQYTEEGLYKQVYGSLNNTVKALMAADIERKRVEQMREDWIVNLSHDLKTPLSFIKGYGQLLNEPDYELTAEERKKFSEIILNKTAYMEMLMDDLKLAQKLKNGLVPIQKTSGNLVELFREIVIDLLNDPNYTNRKVVFEPEEEWAYFEYDHILMQRALTNIIHNAVVHNSEDTLVKVEITVKDDICIHVTDNGNGISEEDQKNLFERYYRGTNTEASTSGSGLGLAIAKQVIEAHGGKIELESEIGKGTVIKIQFKSGCHTIPQ